MAIISTVPKPIFGPKGFIAPAETDVLTGVLADINTAFGGALNPALETPQGQMASSETAVIGNANDNFCNITNMMDPAYASGRMQDGIGRIYYITRLPARPTVVSCLCTGAPGTPIPAGARAKSLDGLIYTCTDGGEIGLDNTVTLTFACNTVGPIACPDNTLNQIYQAIPGWDTINNPADGVLGRLTESRADFEARRFESVAKNARGTVQAVQGAVLEVPNVLDAFSYQNDDDAPVTYRGFELAAHSLYVAAVGGTDQAVAEAIWRKKAPGCVYNGNTNVTVLDTSPVYSEPYPAYTVTFERPDPLTIAFSVVIADNSQVPSDAAAQIQAAIIASFAGADGGARARIGSTIYASRFICPVAALGAWAQVVSLQIGSANTPAAEITASIAASLMTVSAVGSGALAVGQTLVGNGVLDGTTILSQASGTPGGIGTYNVSLAQTVASGAIDAITVDKNSVVVDIDQVPVTSANNIVVELV